MEMHEKANKIELQNVDDEQISRKLCFQCKVNVANICGKKKKFKSN